MSYQNIKDKFFGGKDLPNNEISYEKQIGKLDKYSKQAINYSIDNAGKYLSVPYGEIPNQVVKMVRNQVTYAIQNKLSNQELASNLYHSSKKEKMANPYSQDTYETFTRNWRRIAITESSFAFNNGVIANYTDDVKKGKPQYLVYSGRYNPDEKPNEICNCFRGEIVKIITPEEGEQLKGNDYIAGDPYARRGVWTGKSRIGYGKQNEMISCPSHPNCTHSWLPINPTEENYDIERGVIEPKWVKESEKNKYDGPIYKRLWEAGEKYYETSEEIKRIEAETERENQQRYQDYLALLEKEGGKLKKSFDLFKAGEKKLYRLVRKQIIDKNGHLKTVWVKPDIDDVIEQKGKEVYTDEKGKLWKLVDGKFVRVFEERKQTESDKRLIRKTVEKFRDKLEGAESVETLAKIIKSVKQRFLEPKLGNENAVGRLLNLAKELKKYIGSEKTEKKINGVHRLNGVMLSIIDDKDPHLLKFHEETESPYGEDIRIVRSQYTQKANENYIPEQFKDKLTDYQQDGVNLANEKLKDNKGFIIADSAGLGKTRQLLMLAELQKKNGKTIIVTESQTIIDNAFKKDAGALGIEYELFTGQELENDKIYVTTYSKLDELKNKNPEIIMFDEAHNLKNTISAKTKFAVDIIDNAKKVVLCSATPIETPQQLHYIAKTFGLNYKRFVTDLNKGVDQENKIKDLAYRIAHLSNQLTESGLMIKREKSLKGINFVNYDVKLNGVFRKVYNKAIQNFLNKIKNPDLNATDKGMLIAQNLLALRRISEEAKIQKTVSLIDQEIKSGRQVVLFAERINESNIKVNVTGQELEKRKYEEQLKLLKEKQNELIKEQTKEIENLINEEFSNNIISEMYDKNEQKDIIQTVQNELLKEGLSFEEVISDIKQFGNKDAIEFINVLKTNDLIPDKTLDNIESNLQDKGINVPLSQFVVDKKQKKVEYKLTVGKEESYLSQGTIEKIIEKLEKKGHNIGKIIGDIPFKEREQHIKDFQEGKTKIIVATPQSGGTGINLDDVIGDKPRTIIKMTPNFSASQLVQEISRGMRYTTKSDLKVVTITSNTSIDEWNKKKLMDKLSILGAFVGGEYRKLQIYEENSDNFDNLFEILKDNEMLIPSEKIQDDFNGLTENQEVRKVSNNMAEIIEKYINKGYSEEKAKEMAIKIYDRFNRNRKY